MKRALLLLALLLVCSAAKKDWRDCSVETANNFGRGYRIGGGYVLTVQHVLCDNGPCAITADVDGKPAKVVTRGGGGESDSPDDDGCDWALLFCPKFKSDPRCDLRTPVEGDKLAYMRKGITVRSVSSGVAAFDGVRPVPGNSGSGVTKGLALYGLITTQSAECDCKECPEGYFCAIGPEIIAAVEKARGGKQPAKPTKPAKPGKGKKG